MAEFDPNSDQQSQDDGPREMQITAALRIVSCDAREIYWSRVLRNHLAEKPNDFAGRTKILAKLLPWSTATAESLVQKRD